MKSARVLFALAMIWLGVLGFAKGDFAQIWQPVPKWMPARELLAYLCAFVSLSAGIGLLVERAATMAARVIFASLVIWLLAFRLPNLFYEKPLVLVAWTFGSTAVMAAAAWILSGVAGATGVRAARALYGVSLIPFGLAHFMYLDATTVLIPHWLPWPAAWAYLTGAAFIAAGLAAIFNVYARLAVTLSTLQLVLFSLIVWVPLAVTGPLNDFQRGEFVSTWVLTAGAWVVAASYLGVPWLSARHTRALAADDGR